jgi:hypothetical protein
MSDNLLAGTVVVVGRCVQVLAIRQFARCIDRWELT